MQQQNIFGFQSKTLMNFGGDLIDISIPKIMGILNITPDSFSDGGSYNTQEKALLHAEKLVEEGADIIDVGAQSTRPNAELLTASQEIERLGNTIEQIKKRFPKTLISIDTFYSDVARFAVNQGADIVNDISGGQFDEKMFETVAELGTPYVLMHCNSSYETMHQKIEYEDITFSLNYFFSEKIRKLHDLGVKDIIVDPGFGFGKTIEDQYKLLDELQYITFGQYPLLVGISRKSFIYKPLDKTPHDITQEMRELHLKILQKRAKILRVHDVAEAKKTLDFFLNQ